MKKATVEKVIEIINATIEKEEISYKNIDKKLSDMEIDSIAFIQIIVALEEEFECVIPDSKLLMSELDTVQTFLKDYNMWKCLIEINSVNKMLEVLQLAVSECTKSVLKLKNT